MSKTESSLLFVSPKKNFFRGKKCSFFYLRYSVAVMFKKECRLGFERKRYMFETEVPSITEGVVSKIGAWKRCFGEACCHSPATL